MLCEQPAASTFSGTCHDPESDSDLPRAPWRCRSSLTKKLDGQAPGALVGAGTRVDTFEYVHGHSSATGGRFCGEGGRLVVVPHLLTTWMRSAADISSPEVSASGLAARRLNSAGARRLRGRHVLRHRVRASATGRLRRAGGGVAERRRGLARSGGDVRPPWGGAPRLPAAPSAEARRGHGAWSRRARLGSQSPSHTLEHNPVVGMARAAQEGRGRGRPAQQRGVARRLSTGTQRPRRGVGAPASRRRHT